MIRVPLFKHFRDSIGSSELISKEKNRASVYVLYQIDWKSKYWKKKTHKYFRQQPRQTILYDLVVEGTFKAL